MEIKKKTPHQLEVLEKLYSEDNYPTQSVLKKHASDLGLTYKQIRGWFVEKRRKKEDNKKIVLSSTASVKKIPIHGEKNGFGFAASGKKVKQGSLNYKALTCKKVHLNKNLKRKKSLSYLQNLLSSKYIMAKIFRKDGPLLGVEFDSLPSRAFFNHKGFSLKITRSGFQENQRAAKKQKVLKHAVPIRSDCIKETAPVTKHGIGKGLMTVWHHTNPDAGDFPTGITVNDGDVAGESIVSTSLSQASSLRKRNLRHVPVIKQGNKLRDKRKNAKRRREVQSDKEGKQKKFRKIKCDLAFEQPTSKGHFNHLAMLIDDEELELREQQAGPNPALCCNHFAREGLNSCSLCKDLLPPFPPSCVKMRQLFKTHPWDSCPETVKELFKILHFLFTYGVVIDIRPFTLDEFAQAFHDKDSLLLGKVHLALLKLLLNDVESELNGGSLPHSSKSSKFLVLINSLENKESSLDVWKRSLNPLTWTEILHQMLIAARFGCNQVTMHSEILSQEMNLMTKYGLRPGTLKGELFKVLMEQGNIGMKVSDIATLSEIENLNLSSSIEELEPLICSALSSDITLFEKISSTTFRLRIDPATVEVDEFQSDIDSGSVDDVPANMFLCGVGDDSECNSGYSDASRFKSQKTKSNMPTVCTEIDVSHPGEAWLLGLMDSEYSDLSIEEKLNALVALIDLLSDGISLRMKDRTTTVENIPNCHRHGSGAKVKRSLPNQHYFPTPFWTNAGHSNSVQEGYNSLEHQPIDSSTSILKFYLKETIKENIHADGIDPLVDFHPMQSLFLGSDRRYNRYWLFLGPCNEFDPGHRRVYFESSEDGHWEVIDSTEALCALLSVLDDRGKREAFLIESLEKRQTFLCEEMSKGIVRNEQSTVSDQSELDMIREDSYSSISDLDNLNRSEMPCNSLSSSGAINLEVGNKRDQMHKWSRLKAFDSWIWNSFYSNLHTVRHGKRSYLDSLARCESCNDLYWRDERHCKICHTTFELDFDMEERYAVHTATCREKEDDNLFPKHKILSSKLQSLKCAVHVIESVMPEDAMSAAWRKSAHKLWIKRLRRTSSVTELLQVLADFVGAINEDWLYQCGCEQGCPDIVEEIVTSYSFLPQTSSAVALLLVKLDALVSLYMERSKSEKQQQHQLTYCRGKRAAKK